MPEDWTVRTPVTRGEWDAYYELRWSILRRPWGIPEQLDDDEEGSLHLAVFHPEGKILATGRLVFHPGKTGQVRSMAVDPDCWKAGLGRRVLESLEKGARDREIKMLFLHAREEAVPFYERCGYRVIGPSYRLQDAIQHYRMEKSLPVDDYQK